MTRFCQLLETGYRRYTDCCGRHTREPTTLFHGESSLVSATGIQQGDPIGPALFSLGIDECVVSRRYHDGKHTDEGILYRGKTSHEDERDRVGIQRKEMPVDDFAAFARGGRAE